MTVQELARYSSVNENTIKTTPLKVKGATIRDDEIEIPEGSRWPYDAHRYKFNTREKRIDALLDATDRYRYIDECILGLTKESFQTMLDELIKAELLQPNGSSNQFGANRYDTTVLYNRIRNKRCADRVKIITDILASAAGSFVGGVIK